MSEATEPQDWVALLGVKGGPAVNPHGSMPTSHLLRLAGRTIVVDCGAGVTAGIARQGVPLKSIDSIFITHLHSDHYLEFGPLLHTAWTSGLRSKIRVFGPSGLGDYWRHFIQSMRFDIDTRRADEGRPDLEPLVEITSLDAGDVVIDGGITVRAIRNVHPPLVDSFALRFDTDKSSVVFSGDTAFHPPLAEFAKCARLLIHEAMFPEAIDRLVARLGNGDDRLRRHMFASHTPVEDVGRIATMAGVSMLVLNHFVPGEDPLLTREDWYDGARKHWSGPLGIGVDGLRLPI